MGFSRSIFTFSFISQWNTKWSIKFNYMNWKTDSNMGLQDGNKQTDPLSYGVISIAQTFVASVFKENVRIQHPSNSLKRAHFRHNKNSYLGKWRNIDTFDYIVECDGPATADGSRSGEADPGSSAVDVETATEPGNNAIKLFCCNLWCQNYG